MNLTKLTYFGFESSHSSGYCIVSAEQFEYVFAEPVQPQRGRWSEEARIYRDKHVIEMLCKLIKFVLTFVTFVVQQGFPVHQNQEEEASPDWQHILSTWSLLSKDVLLYVR